MNILSIEKLRKSYDRGKTFALDGLDLALPQGAIGAIVGESGSGKTTLLRLIAGLDRPDEGHIRLLDREVSNPQRILPPQQRNTGMVFQDFALFPHLTVQENIAYGLANKSGNQVNDLLELVSLSGYGQRYPHQLSGGQQQRVAIARALAPQPSLLLLDEPFSSLDALLKSQLRLEVQSILQKAGTSALFITHDPQDAFAIADYLFFLQAGKIVEQGPMNQLAQNAQSDYVRSVFEEMRQSANGVLRRLQ